MACRARGWRLDAMNNIVIGTDGSPEACAAVSKGLDLAARVDARVTFVSVRDVISMLRHDDDRRIGAGVAALDDALAEAERRGVGADAEDAQGDPGAATRTYRAAVVRDFHEPLAVEQVARLALEAGQIRVRVEATGLCHTDIHAAHGDWPVKPTPPFVPGHEGVGIVEELGRGVTEVAVGDRVAMPWLGYACGTCDYCVSGWETLCLEQKNMGYSI